MQGFGYEMEMNTYFFVMGLFCKRRLIEDVVELYEYKMGSADKPPVQDGIFLLRKAVMWSKELNMQLFSRVVETFTNGGNSLTTSILDMVVKSLISVNRLKECGTILKAMEKGGFVPTNEVYNKIIFHLGSVDRGEAVLMINAGHAFKEVLKGFCRKRKATNAYNFLSEMGGFNEALSLLGLMKGHGFPPFLELFIDRISKSGTGDDAISFLKAVTDRKFPSTTVVVLMIEAFLKAGRHNEAQNCFSKSPSYIHNHADVLNLSLHQNC
ncbi:hypothetical protein IFM89_010637 [Coptis chinensis]|uniref:Pentatricopeptide repeat-containing protein n=1 Tax=Coptis chinensis TaxID=261450 RepID=A0A835MDR4_9MAGN|nr:hypothetical protein IFM89_010637 [Coptis chinensis]